MTEDDLGALCARLKAASERLDELMFDEVFPRELGPPASDAALERLGKRYGLTLPPSYAAFLRLHDGWRGFRGDADLLSVADHGEAWVTEELSARSDLFDEFGEANPIKAGAMPVMLGEGVSTCLLLEPAPPGGKATPRLAQYDHSQFEEAYPDFADFLRHNLGIVERLIDKHTRGAGPDDA